MPVIDVRPGLAMAYEDHWFGAPWTTPETIVMIHGNSESSRAWTQWVPHLAGKYRVVRPDLPGFGASPPPQDYGFTAKELAADIGCFLDAMGIARCHLIGAKYGGSACMQFGTDQPHRLLSLCLFGSPVRGSGSGNADLIRDKGVHRWAAETMRARLGSVASEAQLKWWADELMGKTAQHSAFSASAARIDMTLEAGLSRIAAPTLIVTTTESGLQSVEAVKQYAKQFGDARVLVLPGDSYHIAAVEPALCAQHALAFIDEASRRHAAANTRAAE
jgi:3-oxoadipate enol-lactonase